MEKKEIKVEYVPEHLSLYEEYGNGLFSKKYEDTRDEYFSIIGGLTVLLFACQIPIEALVILTLIAILFVGVLILFKWINYKKEKRKIDSSYLEWHEKNIKEGFFKIEYDENTITLFSQVKEHVFLWTDIRGLVYDESVLRFQDDDGESKLTLPKLTLGEKEYNELLNFSKRMVFRCHYVRIS